MKNNMKRIVITGLGLITPIGKDIKIAFTQLLKGYCGIRVFF